MKKILNKYTVTNCTRIYFNSLFYSQLLILNVMQANGYAEVVGLPFHGSVLPCICRTSGIVQSCRASLADISTKNKQLSSCSQDIYNWTQVNSKLSRNGYASSVADHIIGKCFP